jgi:hypothetical protein
LILDRALVLERADGSARRALAQVGGSGEIGRCEAHDSRENRELLSKLRPMAEPVGLAKGWRSTSH